MSEETFNFTQDLRRRMVDDLYASGQLPADPKERELMRKLLADMDGQVVNVKKLDIDNRNANSAEAVAQGMRHLIAQSGNRNPFEVDVTDDSKTLPPPVEIERLGTFEYVEGEDHIGVVTETSDEFVRRMESQENGPEPV